MSQRTWAWPQHPYPELTTTFNSNSRESKVLSGLCRHLHTHYLTQTSSRVYSSNKILKRKTSMRTNEMYVPTYFYRKESLINPLAPRDLHIFGISQSWSIVVLLCSCQCWEHPLTHMREGKLGELRWRVIPEIVGNPNLIPSQSSSPGFSWNLSQHFF